MPESFGTRLRQRREDQGIALGAIAEQLKIKLSLLEAVERDDVSNWPSGIYRRAFIRAYAHAIGLNPDVVVREFLELYPDPEHLVAAPPASASEIETARTSSGPPTRLRNIMELAIGSLSRLGRGPATEEEPAVSRSSSTIQDLPEDDWAPSRPARWESVATPPQVPAPPAVVEPPPSESPEPTPFAADEPAAYAWVEAPNVEPPDVERRNDVAADFQFTPAAPPEPAVAFDPARAAQAPQPNEAESVEPEFLALAHLCTDLGRVQTAEELQPLLQEAARIIGATGLIVWISDPTGEELAPALVHGYSDKVLAQLPTVSRDADNPTAATFRSGRACAINGSAQSSGALVVPLVESYGCTGVLAIELQDGREQTTFVEAAATIVAAALTQLIGRAQPVEAAAAPEFVDEKHAENFTRPLRVRR